MRTLVRRTTAAIVAVGLAVLPAVTTRAAWADVTPPPATAQSGDAGAAWLATQLSANGGFITTVTGAPSLSDTADAVLALHAAGVGQSAAAAGLAWLQGHIADAGSDPGLLAKLILVADAAGVPPSDFAGQPGTADDLVTALLATMQTTGPNAGLFGSADPTYDGAFRQGLVLMALAAAGRAAADVAPAVSWLQNQQCASGAWQAFRIDTTLPCGPPDPASFSGPETNSTSLAVAGLAAIGGTAAIPAAGLAWLSANQDNDGGWAYYPGAASVSDPNSTAVVLWAYDALGVAPPASAYTRLQAFQLTSGPEAGAFWYDFGDGTQKPSMSATVQAVPAAAGRAFPLGASPIPSQVTPTPTSSPSQSEKATASPSPSASASSRTAASATPSATAAPQATTSDTSDPTPSDTTSPDPTPETSVAGSVTPGEEADLAATGAQVLGVLSIALVVLLIGTAMLLAARRRRGTGSHDR
jgi:hypothetical protein